jgi:PAS domain S-box-containing protein
MIADCPVTPRFGANVVMHTVETNGPEEVEALRMRLRLQALVSRAATSRSGELDELLDQCADMIATALKADSLGIWVVTDGPGELTLTASAARPGEPQPEPVAQVSIGPEHAAAMAAAAHPAVFRDPRLRTPLFPDPLNGPTRHATVSPLVVDGNRLIGLLAMLHPDPLPVSVEETLASLVDPLALAVEKERAVERLQEREEGLGTMIRTAPDGMVMMDQDSRILGTNPSLDRIFGYDEGELLGQSITRLMPERFRSRHDAGVRRYGETGKKRVSWTGLELVGVRKDGSEFPIEISFGEFFQDGRRVYTGFVRDVSERKAAEARERRKRRVIQATAVYIGSAFVALQALDLLLPVLPLPDWTLGAIIALAAAGLPVAGGLAWTHETRAGGGYGTAPARHRGDRAVDGVDGAHDRDRTGGGRRSHRNWRRATARAASPTMAVLGVVAVLAAGTWLAGSSIRAPWRPEGAGLFGAGRSPAVAAVPFNVIGARPEDDALAAGLVEDLVTALAARPEVQVVSASGAGTRPAYLVEGSVRLVGGRIRVSARLVHASRHSQAWGSTYDREAGDVLEFQTEVAHAIADAVVEQLRRTR